MLWYSLWVTVSDHASCRCVTEHRMFIYRSMVLVVCCVALWVQRGEPTVIWECQCRLLTVYINVVFAINDNVVDIFVASTFYTGLVAIVHAILGNTLMMSTGRLSHFAQLGGTLLTLRAVQNVAACPSMPVTSRCLLAVGILNVMMAQQCLHRMTYHIGTRFYAYLCVYFLQAYFWCVVVLFSQQSKTYYRQHCVAHSTSVLVTQGGGDFEVFCPPGRHVAWWGDVWHGGVDCRSNLSTPNLTHIGARVGCGPYS